MLIVSEARRAHLRGGGSLAFLLFVVLGVPTTVALLRIEAGLDYRINYKLQDAVSVKMTYVNYRDHKRYTC